MIPLFVCLGIFAFLALIFAIVFVKVLGIAAGTIVLLVKILGPVLLVAALAFLVYNGVCYCRRNNASACKAEAEVDVIVAKKPRRKRRKD